MSEDTKPKALARSLIYSSRWVNLYVDRVQFPNGRIIEQHHLVDFDHPSVMVLARESAARSEPAPRNEPGRFLMVQVSRYTTGRTEWEFPAGGVEPGESVLDAARRELLEETGCRCTDLELLYTFHPLNGISNQVANIARCNALPPEQGFDTSEINKVAWFTVDEIWQMIRSGEMQDGFALLAFLLDLHL